MQPAPREGSGSEAGLCWIGQTQSRAQRTGGSPSVPSQPPQLCSVLTSPPRICTRVQTVLSTRKKKTLLPPPCPLTPDFIPIQGWKSKAGSAPARPVRKHRQGGGRGAECHCHCAVTAGRGQELLRSPRQPCLLWSNTPELPPLPGPRGKELLAMAEPTDTLLESDPQNIGKTGY